MRIGPLVCALLAGCGGAPAIEVALRVPPGDHPLAGADGVVLSIYDSAGQVVAARRAPASAPSLALDPVPAGHGLTVELDATLGPDVVARGRSCPFDLDAGKPAPRVPVYFSTVGRFAPAGAPATARDEAAAFSTSGGALVAGGASGGTPLASTERYDQASGTFSPGPDLTAARAGAGAALLPDGTALIFGGAAAGAIGLESFSMGQMTPLPVSFPPTLTGEASLTLADERVLIAGGLDASGQATSAALLLSGDGAALTVTSPLQRARTDHTLTPTGEARLSTVLVAGGRAATGPVPELELFDPGDASFALVGAELSTPRYDHTATLLADGRILIAGGFDATGAPTASVAIFDPATRSLVAAPGLKTARARHTATRLPSGRVLLAGGLDASGAPTASAEIFDPSLGTVGDFVPTAPLGTPRAGHAAVPLCDGTLLFVGGGAGAEVYNPAP